MVRLPLAQTTGKRIKTEQRRPLKDRGPAFKWPHPIRKPPRMKGKVQNRGIKKVKKA